MLETQEAQETEQTIRNAKIDVQTVKVYFDVTEKGIKDLTTEEYEALEMAMDGEIKMYRLRPVICRFVVNEDGSPMEHAVAMKMVGKIPVARMGEVMKGFTESLKERAVPKETGNSSVQPVEQNVAEFPSPSGS